VKVGDKVRAIGDYYGFGNYVQIGSLGVIKSISGSKLYVNFPNISGWVSIIQDLELVDDLQPLDDNHYEVY